MNTCTVDDCHQPHRARGLCGTHYNQTFGATRHRKVTVACGNCGAPCEKEASRVKRYAALFCSLPCRDAWNKRNGHAGRRPNRCHLPAGHPVMLLIKQAKERTTVEETAARQAKHAAMAARAAETVALMTPRTCEECGQTYAPGTTIQRYCSKTCARRVAKRARKAREHGATGAFTWPEVIGIFLRFDRRCAYCRQSVGGQPEPDHVVPLSRGGSNSITNILPACRMCNADKRDLLLHEWAVDRQRRGVPPRATTWASGEPRYIHLTSTTLTAAA